MVFREVGLGITAAWIFLVVGFVGISIGVALVVVLLVNHLKNNHDRVELEWREVDKVIGRWDGLCS